MPDASERFRLLYDLGCAFAERRELDELIPLVVSKCRETLDAEGVAVLLLDPEGREFHFPFVAEEDQEVAARLVRLRCPADRGFAGAVGILPEAVAALVAFPWPGNVRELQNEIERAVALSQDGQPIGPTTLSPHVTAAAGAQAEPETAEALTASDLRVARARFEVDFIRTVLSEHGGNVSHAAKALGISRAALQNKMKEYGLR